MGSAIRLRLQYRSKFLLRYSSAGRFLGGEAFRGLSGADRESWVALVENKALPEPMPIPRRPCNRLFVLLEERLERVSLGLPLHPVWIEVGSDPSSESCD